MSHTEEPVDNLCGTQQVCDESRDFSAEIACENGADLGLLKSSHQSPESVLNLVLFSHLSAKLNGQKGRSGDD